MQGEGDEELARCNPGSVLLLGKSARAVQGKIVEEIYYQEQ